MTTGSPTLGYQHCSVSGTVAVYHDGPVRHVVATVEPVTWRIVVGRTIKWSIFAVGGAVLLLAAVSTPGNVLSWIVFAGATALVVRAFKRVNSARHRPRREGVQFVANPDGLSWIRPGVAEPVTFAAGSVERVKLHVSPPAFRRTHPVTVVLVLRGGQEHVLGMGKFDETILILNAIEEGLGMQTSTEVGDG